MNLLKNIIWVPVCIVTVVTFQNMRVRQNTQPYTLQNSHDARDGNLFTPEELKQNERIGTLTKDAVTLRNKEKFNDSIAIYKEIITMNPRNLIAILGMARSYELLKDYDSAYALYSKVYASEDPGMVVTGSGEDEFHASYIFCLKNRPNIALRMYLNGASSYAEGWENGYLLPILNEQSSVRQIKEASLIGMSLLAENDGRINEAISYLEEAQKNNPKNITSTYFLGLFIAQRSGNSISGIEEAKPYLEIAMNKGTEKMQKKVRVLLEYHKYKTANNSEKPRISN